MTIFWKTIFLEKACGNYRRLEKVASDILEVRNKPFFVSINFSVSVCYFTSVILLVYLDHHDSKP